MKNVKNLKKAVCFCFNTVNTISIDYTHNEPLKECIDLCYKIDRLMNRFNQESDIYKINHSDGQKIEVDPMTAEVIRKSIFCSEITKGTFDIAIGAVSALWNFGLEHPEIPEQLEIHKKSSYVDSEKIIVNRNEISIAEGMHIDLGGIAKGYAADKIIETLKKYEVNSGFINLGGNIAVIGNGEEDKGWRVGIQSPFDQESISAVLSLKNRFISTSGIYERCFVYDNADYHHILNTCSGMPVQNDLASVSLITTEGALGDAFATACICMGFETALSFIKEYTKERIEALFIFKDRKIYWHGREKCFITEN